MSVKGPVDLTSICETFAKDYFRRKATGFRERRLISNDKIGVDIDWRRVQFSHDTPKYEPHPPKPGTGTPLNNCLFDTSYANKTDRDQTYNFKAERTTTSTCTIEIEQTYTQGWECGITLKTPCEILEANVGFHREIELTSLTGETVEESMTWGVDSDVVVKSGHRAEAKMNITEEEYNGKFLMKTTVQGIVKINFINLKNNGFIRTMETNIYDVIDWAKENRMLPEGDSADAVVLDSSNNAVVLTTRGKCQFKYGLKQDVVVDQHPL